MIDESLASAARKKLSDVVGTAWDRIESQIEDNGSYLLLTARIAWGEPKAVAAELARDVKTTLNELIPQHSGNEVGSWMVNVWYGDALIDSILPDEP